MCPLLPLPSSPFPSYERATSCLGFPRLSLLATAHRIRGEGCVNSLLLPVTRELRQPAYLKHLLGQAPPSLGPQDQGYRLVPLSPPPSSRLPALEEAKPAILLHLLTYLLELEKTKLVTLLHLHLYANVGYEQSRLTQARSCSQTPSHGQQDQGHRKCPPPPPPSSTPPRYEQAMSSLDPSRSPPRASTHRTGGTGRIHYLLLPTLHSSQLRASYEQPRPLQAAPTSCGPQDEQRRQGLRAVALRTIHGPSTSTMVSPGLRLRTSAAGRVHSPLTPASTCPRSRLKYLPHLLLLLPRPMHLVRLRMRSLLKLRMTRTKYTLMILML